MTKLEAGQVWAVQGEASSVKAARTILRIKKRRLYGIMVYFRVPGNDYCFRCFPHEFKEWIERTTATLQEKKL